MHASTQVLHLEGGTPALDAMEPRGVRRRAVRMQARGPGAPSADQRGLVRLVVVHDDVHVQVGRHLDIEGGQEGATRDRAMPPTNLTPHVSRLHGQCGKARRRPVPVVVVGPPVSVARAQGEHRRRAIPGLDLRRFVDAEDRGVRRRIEIPPTMSRTLSMRNGSGDRVKGFVRCGCSPKACQMRGTLIGPRWSRPPGSSCCGGR